MPSNPYCSLSLLRGVFFAGSGLIILNSVTAAGAVAPAGGTSISFNRDIRPILAENCMSCHGPDPGSRKAGLRLDTEAGLFEKRKEDPAAVVRGKAAESELFKRLISQDPDEVMPPPDSHKKLKPAEIELLKRWIDSGAAWQPHWSLMVPEKAPLPEVRNSAWVKNPIDRFVLAKLESKGLSPAPEVEPRVLFRRLRFDLTGLPPKPSEMEAFVTDYSADKERAISQWVDRLMHSTAWGEHRARYWLDAARYGDTHGLHFDNYREMWMYRDWVIRAFNANQPFDQFTVDQIAGDLLPGAREDQLIATGFQRCNITTNEGGTIPEENLAVYASDRVQTMGWVYLGMTMNCAQCHDHKFDPFTTRDYYAMAAFFRNTTQGAFDKNSRDGGGPVLVVPNQQDRPRWDALPGLVTEARSKMESRKTEARVEYESWLTGVSAEGVAAELPSEQLVVRAAFNEGEGVAPKLSGEIQGVAKSSGPVQWVPGGKFGKAPVLKKEATFSLGDAGRFSTKQSFSFGAWVKAGKEGVNGSILARMDVKSKLRGYELQQNDRSLSVKLINEWPENALSVTAVRVLRPGAWQHVFVTYDGSGKPGGVKIYIDGREEKLSPGVNKLKPDDAVAEVPLLVGQRSADSFFEGGSVQEVRVYGRVLSPHEIKRLVEHPSLREAAVAEPAKRTPKQKDLLLGHFLAAKDVPYRTWNAKLVGLEAEKEAIRQRSPVTHVQEEIKDKMAVTNVLMRGQYNKLGEEVVAAPPSVMHPLPPDAPKNRLGLARWLVDKRNPLTARVTVNRFWQEVFGQGLVKTSEDFGIMGAVPSNQDLLDWLAVDFRETGGDVQRLFKLMLTSATYRQSAEVTPEKLEKDRENALLSRGPRFRMDAEMIRDNALAVSGLLSERMYGPSVRPYQPEGIWDVVGLPGGDTREFVQDHGESLYRRSLYSFWKRMAPPPSMDVFNAPSREVSCLRRDRTNTPLQALVTLNDVQFVEAARRLAENALLRAESAEDRRLDYLFNQVLGRSASAKEKDILMAAQRDFLKHYQVNAKDAEALVSVGESPRLVASAELPKLAAWTMVCNQILNLDETLNK